MISHLLRYLSIALFGLILGPAIALAADIQIDPSDVVLSGSGNTTADFSGVPGLEGSYICSGGVSSLSGRPFLGGGTIGTKGGSFAFNDFFASAGTAAGTYGYGTCPHGGFRWGNPYSVDTAGINLQNGGVSLPDGNYTHVFIGYPDNYYFDYTISSGTVTPSPTVVPDYRTRIISLTPGNGTTTNPVTFTLHAYINPDDLGFWQSIKITYFYHSQNFVLAPDVYLLDSVAATTSGDFYFSTTTTLYDPSGVAYTNGSFLSEAFLQTSYVGGLFVNPFGTNITDIYKQWSIGAGTFLGNAYQASVGTTQDVLNSYTGTSTPYSLSACVPGFSFDVPICLASLFIPSSEGLSSVVTNITNQVLVKFPFGYITRTYAIFTATTSATLPTISTTVPSISPANAGQTITLDPWAGFTYVANATSTDSGGLTFRQLTEIYWRTIILVAFGAIVFMRLLKLR